MAGAQENGDFVTISVTADQKACLETAAKACNLTLEAFVLAAACDAAMRTLAM